MVNITLYIYICPVHIIHIFRYIHVTYYVKYSNGQATTISPLWSSHSRQRCLACWEAQPFPRVRRLQSAASVDRDASFASMALHCWAYARSWLRQRRFGTVSRGCRRDFTGFGGQASRMLPGGLYMNFIRVVWNFIGVYI